MAAKSESAAPFNVVVVGQDGRLMYEALLFAASLRQSDPGFSGRLFVAEPQPGPLWPGDPRMKQSDARAAFDRLGAEILPFESRHFGHAYPYGNKIEALLALPEGEPFVFFDTDTLITGPLSEVPFDFSRPCASLKAEGTWPQIELYGPGYAEIWKSLYDRFGLDFESTLDLSQPDEYWRRYLYFNAGFFFYECPGVFGRRYLEIALAIRDDPPEAAQLQVFDPWLDQVALPLVIHALGGARRTIPADTLDGRTSCHYRTFPLLFAREEDRVVEVLREAASPNWIKKVLKEYEPIRRLVYQPKGDRIRGMFDRDHLPRREQMIRNQIKKAGLWMR
ncbi:hypothetical protein [Celeribacter indicus]|uniref:Uncharacterized protein n=1 Tax=Celeribacter indicus TaxID=1208324 RepID=A0A0B5DX07_9RHOB|nr:hypothetical protein [Celeribacter indicus]AJE47988.1 hypothetical protein P73_3273 [Celeribacter indicus]SDW28779.1 hypothetical protein SAMN05443573_102263 [Celeribacter indicus]